MLPGVGVVGSGPLVHFLVPLLRDKGFPVAGIWGVHQTQVDSVAEELQIPFSTDSIDVLLLKKEVQLVVVACPPHLHSAIVTKAFNVGKHVLCDWTAALTTAEMSDMVERAKYYPALISILCHPLRFLDSCKQMRSFLESKYLGQVHLIEANISGDQLLKLGNLYSVNCDHYMGGGILPTVASHIIDLISFVTNSRAKRVSGLVRRLTNDQNDAKSNLNRGTTSDYCTFQMELESREQKTAVRDPLLLSTVTINSHIPNAYVHEIRVYGSRGMLLLKGGSLYERRYEESRSGDGDSELELVSSEDVDQRLRLGELLPSPYDQGLNKLISTLSNAFREDESEFTSKALPTESSLDHQTNGTDSSYSSAASSLNSTDMNNRTDTEKMKFWFKEAVSLAANFEDGQYIQAVIESLKESSERREWVRVRYNTPYSVMSPSKSKFNHRR